MDYRKYYLRPDTGMMLGYTYTMKIPCGIFRDINNFTNDSTAVKVGIPNDETLSGLQLNLVNVSGKYIVELQDEKRSEVLASFIVTEDKLVKFPYLNAGKYYVRITEDVNNNSFVDSGSLLEHRMPEKVKFLKINDDPLIDIPESSEILQTVDISEIF